MCVCDNLPAPIVAALHAFVERLHTDLAAHYDADLATHEQALLATWRAEAGALLSAILAVATTGAEADGRPPRSPCPACGTGCASERWRPRQVQSCVGPVHLRRTVYHCAVCGHRWARADQTLGLAPRQQSSATVQAWEARVAAVLPFREAARLLAELSGVAPGHETVRTHAEHQGATLEAAQQHQIAYVQTEQEPLPGTADPAPGRLVVETDGVQVHYRCPPDCCETGWHELKLGIVGGWVGQRPDATVQAPSYVGARAEVNAFAPRLVAEAARRGGLDVVGWEQPPGVDPRLAGSSGPSLARLRSAVVLGDGASWIWQSVAPLLGPERVEIVDWFHATEHLWTVAKALGGEQSPTTTAWAQHAGRLLWERGSAGLLPHLLATTAPTSEATTVLERERGYFRRNAERMRYQFFRQQGLPIGSGAVESSAKYLVQQRLKGAGMRWSEAGAHAILQLRCQALTQAAQAASSALPARAA
jgi:hypothetical protein